MQTSKEMRRYGGRWTISSQRESRKWARMKDRSFSWTTGASRLRNRNRASCHNLISCSTSTTSPTLRWHHHHYLRLSPIPITRDGDCVYSVVIFLRETLSARKKQSLAQMQGLTTFAAEMMRPACLYLLASDVVPRGRRVGTKLLPATKMLGIRAARATTLLAAACQELSVKDQGASSTARERSRPPCPWRRGRLDPRWKLKSKRRLRLS